MPSEAVDVGQLVGRSTRSQRLSRHRKESPFNGTSLTVSTVTPDSFVAGQTPRGHDAGGCAATCGWCLTPTPPCPASFGAGGQGIEQRSADRIRCRASARRTRKSLKNLSNRHAPAHAPITFTSTRFGRRPSNSPKKICSQGPKSSLPAVIATTTSRPITCRFRWASALSSPVRLWR